MIPQIKLFVDSDFVNLQKCVNLFLKNNVNTITDLSFTYQMQVPAIGIPIYSIMINYKLKSEKRLFE